jgi:adenylate kinase
VNIILFGPPGSGKGTQGDNLVKKYNLFKVSSGDLLRQEIKRKTFLGNKIKSLMDKGMLVSDEIINNIIEDILLKKRHSNNLIFDGYPRNLSQGIELDKLLKKYNEKITCVLSLNVDKSSIIKRVLGRQICSNCGLTFNEYFNPSTNENHNCDSKFLTIRSDDSENVIIERYETYLKETFPLIKYYINQNLLKEINGMQKIGEINEEIRQIIDSLET